MSDVEGSGVKGNKWLALLGVTLAFAYTFLSRFIWTSVQETAMAEFGIDTVQAALYISMFFAGYLITQLPGGVLADRFQPKVILITCTLLGAISTGVMCFTPSYELGLALRVITGISSGCVMASCSKIVAVNFPGHQRATGMGILLAAPPVGILLANQIGPQLNAAVGWRNTFLAVAGIGLVIVAVILLFVKKTPKQEPAPSQQKAGVFEGLRRYFTDPQQLVAGLSGFMFMFVNVGFATWAMKYALSLGFTPIQGGQIITMYSLAGILATCLSGGLARKLNMSHKQFLMLSLAAIGIVSILFAIPKSYGILIAIAIMYGFVSYLPSTHYTTLAMMRAGDHHAASAAASQNLIFQSSGLIQPVIVGAVIEATGNTGVTWIIFAFCMVIAFGLALLIKKEPAAAEQVSASKKLQKKEA